MRRLFLALALTLCFAAPGHAQTSLPGGGVRPSGFFQDNEVVAGPNASYLTLGNDPSLTNNRILSPTARFTITNNGPQANYVLELATVQAGYGGTGGTTYQAGFNNLAGGTAGSAVATGDTLYYGGTNWTRLPVGTNGQYLNVTGGIPTWATAPTGALATDPFIMATAAADCPNSFVQTAGTGITVTNAGGLSTLAIDSTVVTKTGTQTLTNKTLTAPAINAAQTTGFLLNGSTKTDTIVITDPAANQTLTIPDTGGNAAFVMTATAQTIAGVKTLSASPVFSTNALTTSGAFTITIPNSASDTLAMLAATQTLTNKTLTSPVIGTSLVLSATHNYTLTWTSPSGAVTINYPDPGANVDMVYKTSAATATAGGIAYGTGASTLNFSAAGTTGQPALSGGSGAITFGTLGPTVGGTNQTAYTTGDILYASGTNTLSRLAIGSSTNVLTVVAGVPAWSAASGTGTVTSVAQSVSAFPMLTVSGSPITTSGTLTLTASGTTGDLPYCSAANTYSKLGIGSTGQVLTVVSGAPAWATASGGLGGNGVDGSITVSTNTTESTIKQRNTSAFSITGATTYTVISGTVINSTSTITIGDSSNAGVLTVGAGAAGGAIQNSVITSSAQPGQGPSGGMGGIADAVTFYTGGGGGGCGGAGGNSGVPTGSSVVAQGGAAIPLGQGLLGSGGGGGLPGSTNTIISSGGAGGGNFKMIATGNIVIAASATLKALGTAAIQGTGTTFTGAGGGSGGVISLYSTTGTVTVTGTVSVAGGAGANGSSSTGTGGGGGGAGILLRMSASTPGGAGTITVSGGAAGTNGATVPTAGGSSTAIAITGTPSLPLLSMHDKWLPQMESQAQIAATIELVNTGKRPIEIAETKRENILSICKWEGGDMLQQMRTAQKLSNADSMTAMSNEDDFSAVGTEESEEIKNAA